MSLSNLATVFGPTLMRPPVGSVDQCAVPLDISQEVDVQVSQLPFCLSECDIYYSYLQQQKIEADVSLCVSPQVHVIYLYLQIQNLPEALTTQPLDTEEDS